MKIIKRKLQSLRDIPAWSQEHKHLVTPVALIVGFILDNITLNRIDQVFDNGVFIVYIFVVGISIYLIYRKHTPTKLFLTREKANLVLSAIIAFGFGGLFSGFVVFYGRSADFLTAWVFLIILVGLMLATEFKKHYFEKFLIRITIFFSALYLYLAFAFPIIFKEMNYVLFIFAGLFSMLLTFCLVLFVRKQNKELFARYKNATIVSVLSAFFIFNGLYITNILPPIPLSLKHAEVYYSIEKADGNYIAEYEKTPWYVIWRKMSNSIEISKGDYVYVFGSVFAPTKLETDIYHQWYFYNEDTGEWEERDRIHIPITGGRDDGYRGFSKKKSLQEGRWKVSFETQRGQKLGSTRFSVEFSEEQPELHPIEL
jgi:hypothetical protein